MMVLATAFDSSGNVIAYSQSFPNFVAGGSSGLNGWITAPSTTTNITGLPADVYEVDGYWNIIVGTNPVFGRCFSGQPTGGAYTGMVMGWPTAGDRVTADLVMNRRGTYRQMEILDGLQPNATSWTIASPTLPPWDSANIASAAARVVSWFPDGPLTHDGNVLKLTWYRSNAAQTMTWYYNWYIITPPDVTTITLPKLPAPFAAETPQLDDPLYVNQLEMVEIPTVMGYDAFRALPEAAVTCLDCSVRDGTFPRVIRSN